MSEEKTPVAELGNKENPIVVEEHPEEDKLLSMLIKSVTKAIIHGEVILLSNEMNKYRKCISTRMLAMEDERLMKTSVRHLHRVGKSGRTAVKMKHLKCFLT